MIEEKKLLKELEGLQFKTPNTPSKRVVNLILGVVINMVKSGQLTIKAVPVDWLMRWIDENKWVEPGIVEVVELKAAIQQKITDEK